MEMGSWGFRKPKGGKKAGYPIRIFPREWGQRMRRAHCRRSATEQGIRLRGWTWRNAGRGED